MSAPQQKPSALLDPGAHTPFLLKRQILNSCGFSHDRDQEIGLSALRIRLSWRSEASQTHDRQKPSQPTDPQETVRGRTRNTKPTSVCGCISANQTHIR